jgi:hypothetical protein
MLAECYVGETLTAQADLLFLGVPLGVTMGSRKEEMLAKLLELVAPASAAASG